MTVTAIVWMALTFGLLFGALGFTTYIFVKYGKQSED